jgi:hypothetical protein
VLAQLAALGPHELVGELEAHAVQRAVAQRAFGGAVGQHQEAGTGPRAALERDDQRGAAVLARDLREA